MTDKLATVPTQSEFEIMQTQAASLVKTGFLPPAVKTAEQALAIILTGRELGIPAMAALNTINVIQGKPTVSPQLMLALIERSGQLENIRFETTDDAVRVTMKRRGRSEHTEKFGLVEARAMKLTGKDNYQKQPAVMYKWRAVAAAARTVFPDVILGLYTPDEMGAETTVTDDGEMLVKSDNVAETLNPRRETLITECGNLFRDLNDWGAEPKWTKATVQALIEGRYGVAGGIHDLLTDEVEALRDFLEAEYRTITESSDFDEPPLNQ